MACDSNQGAVDQMKQRTLQFISRHQKLDGLLAEISSLRPTLVSKDAVPVQGACFEAVAKCKALLSRQPVSQYGAEECATRLLSLVDGTQSQTMTEDLKTSVQSVLLGVKQLMSSGSFSRPRFQNLLCHQKDLPLELIWLLNTEGIFSLESYLSMHQDEAELTGKLASAVTQLRREASNSACVSGILGTLVNLGFMERSDTSETAVQRKMIITVLESITTDFIDEAMVTEGDVSCPAALTLPDGAVAMETLKKAYTHLLTVVLSHKPNQKVSQAVRQQHQWSYGKIPPPLRAWYKQILLVFDGEEVISVLQRVAEQQEVSWQLLLSFVSVFIVCLPESAKSFTDFTERLLCDGLEGSDIESAILGLLLVRQACCHGPSVYFTYTDWFQRTFSDATRSLAGTKKTFTMLIKFLTDLVPYETAQHLKVHVTSPPHVPVKCRSLLTDYIVLAKTRLADLKEPLDPGGSIQSDSRAEDNAKRREQAEEDVQKCVAHFEATGKVPSSVMEASIFRKPYYMGVLLPTLLKPRPLPDIPDAKMKLIEALRRSEKIPRGLYSSYEEACKKEATQLLEGVFLVDDSDDEIHDMALSPLEQLGQCLVQMSALVQSKCGHSSSTSKYTEAELVCLVREKLEEALSSSSKADTDSAEQDSVLSVQDGDTLSPILLDVGHPHIPATLLQLVETLLNWISRTVHLVFRGRNPSFTWLRKLTSALTGFPAVVKALYTRMWTLVIDQGCKLKSHHVEGLAALLVELLLLSNRLPWLQLTGACSHCARLGSLQELVFGALSVSNGANMEYCLSLTAAYLRYCVCACCEEVGSVSKVLIPTMVKKFFYVCTRLVPEVRYIEAGWKPTGMFSVPEQAVIANLFLSETFQQCLQETGFSVSDWVSLELAVIPGEDLLSHRDRREYHIWAIYTHFLSQSCDSGGCNHDSRLVASQLLQELVKAEMRCQLTVPPCPACQERRHYCSTGPTNKNDLVSLLQELTQSFQHPVNVDTDSGQLPWLLTQLQQLLQTDTETDVHKQAAVTAFFRQSQCLASGLLFMDSPHPHPQPDRQTQTDVSVPTVAKFLSDILVKYMNRSFFIPFSVTLYILQGAVAVSAGPRGQDVLTALCDCSPLFLASLLVHRRKLEFLLRESPVRNDPVVQELSRTVAWIESLKDGDPGDACPTSPWIFGLAMFSLSLNSDVAMMDKVIHRSCQLFRKYENISQGLEVLAECLLLHVAYCQLSSSVEEKLQEVLCSDIFLVLLRCSVPVLDSLLREPKEGRLLQCSSSSALKLRPVVLMRLLCKAPVAVGQESNNTLQNLMKLFSTVAAMFELIGKDDTSCRISQPLSVCDMQEMSGFVKSCVWEATPEVLTALNWDLMNSCGADVVNCVQQRLRTT